MSAPTTQVFYCSTLLSAMTIAAGIDAGRFGAGDRRVVIVSDNGPAPEIGTSLAQSPGFAVLRDRVDRVVSWNDLIAPLHPSAWSPRDVEVPMLARALLAHLGLEEPPGELVVESIAVAPARAVATLLRDCPVSVVSDGLMSYGPTRNHLPGELGSRMRRVLYLDLVPALRPVLLREEGVDTDALPDEPVLKVMAEATSVPALADAVVSLPRGGALVLGQYLSALDIMTPAQEATLYADMVRAAARAGHRQVLFKAHPAADRAQAGTVRAAAAEAGVRLTVVPPYLPAELCFAEGRPDLVVGCFSTALLTARSLFGLEVATMGARQVLDALTPYQNSNRIPVTIVDAVVPRLNQDGTTTGAEMAAADLTELVEAVSFCMQPTMLPELRPAAERWLARHGSTRYFTRRRLRATGLAPTSRARTRLADSRIAHWDATRGGLRRARAFRARVDVTRRAARGGTPSR
ncbi:polysialyltransferase family glycosyltransferase [uncultured Jatrophihabitans sp.]|uniref:polysialyltransferase family glycosyltransferase n=1 Tax=uncultured Jatrophihabitans sp. TaxID=1610747 RepID=UPI0035CCA6BE